MQLTRIYIPRAESKKVTPKTKFSHDKLSTSENFERGSIVIHVPIAGVGLEYRIGGIFLITLLLYYATRTRASS